MWSWDLHINKNCINEQESPSEIFWHLTLAFRSTSLEFTMQLKQRYVNIRFHKFEFAYYKAGLNRKHTAYIVKCIIQLQTDSYKVTILLFNIYIYKFLHCHTFIEWFMQSEYIVLFEYILWHALYYYRLTHAWLYCLICLI